jgi:hypothetical protein
MTGDRQFLLRKVRNYLVLMINGKYKMMAGEVWEGKANLVYKTMTKPCFPDLDAIVLNGISIELVAPSGREL